MNEERLVKVALQGGRYEAELHAPEETGIEAVHEGRVIAAGRLVPGEGATRVSVEFPVEILSDGVQVVALRSTVDGGGAGPRDAAGGRCAGRGYPGGGGVLLRDELEMLKRAFRRHVSAQVG
jgi:hypothetical protein